MLNTLSKQPARFETDLKTITLEMEKITLGITQFNDCITYRHGDEVIVYDRICDHNRGLLSLRDGKVICPLHGWTFDPASGCYTNVKCQKEPLARLNLSSKTDLVEIPTLDVR